MRVGQMVTKTWEVKHIVYGDAYKYTECGKKIKYNASFALLANNNGQERVLEIKEGKKPNINDCERYYAWKAFKFSPWNLFTDTSVL
jgi:hypothetical protein